VSAQTSPVTAVVLNGNAALLQTIGEIAESAGFHVVRARPDQVGATPRAIQEFLRANDARVVVYDVAPPLGNSWSILQELRYAEMISGSWRQFVVTTGDKAALNAVVGTNGAMQAIPDALDHGAIGQALQRAILV
jgi:hypothetical protein